MDFFAIILLTVTTLTISGICIFIFICAIQPKVFRSLYRNKHRTYYITASQRISQTNNDTHQINDENSIKITSECEKHAYLKVLEQSIRTGRSIEEEKKRNSFVSSS